MKILEINLENGNRYVDDINASISDAEKYVGEYYKSQGYNFRNLNPYRFCSQIPEKVDDYIEEKIFPHHTTDLSTAGLPDIVVWKETKGEIVELFFTEVKLNQDSLKLEQLIWFSKFSQLNARIFTVYDEQKTNFNPGEHAEGATLAMRKIKDEHNMQMTERMTE